MKHMAKRIEPTHLINFNATNKKGYSYTVVSYIGKQKDYMYLVKFHNGQTIEASRQQIIKFTVRDLITEKKDNSKKRATDWKKLNKKKQENTVIYVDNIANTKLLSIDQSTSATGWAYYHNNELVDFGEIRESSSNTIERICNMVKYISEIIDKYEINLVVMEDIYLQKSLVAYKVLAFLMGNICTALFKKKVPFEIITAPEWKAYHNILKGNRDNQKMLSMKKVNANSDDVSDAILLGMYVWNSVLAEEGW